MSQIKGHWYPQGSSARQSAEVLLYRENDQNCELMVEGSAQRSIGPLAALEFSDRVGNIARKITLPDNSIFESKDNNAIDAVLKDSTHKAAKAGVLHTLENHWGWISTALVFTVLLSISFFKWGLPWSANKLAHAMPISVTNNIGEDVLQLMDKIIFDPSTLSTQKQEALRQHFQSLTTKLGNLQGHTYRFHFRDMHDIPNAMALPSGDIIITDKLVQIAKSQQEIDAVLLHEIGHVIHRHGLQQVIQSTFVTVLIASISGDVSGSSDLLVAFPTFLIQSHYARDHETDADTFAFEQMLKLEIDPKYFAVIMQAMMEEMGEEPESLNKKTPSPKHDATNKNDEDNKNISSYFSTHPITQARIKRAMEYSARFKP